MPSTTTVRILVLCEETIRTDIRQHISANTGKQITIPSCTLQIHETLWKVWRSSWTLSISKLRRQQRRAAAGQSLAGCAWTNGQGQELGVRIKADHHGGFTEGLGKASKKCKPDMVMHLNPPHGKPLTGMSIHSVISAMAPGLHESVIPRIPTPCSKGRRISQCSSSTRWAREAECGDTAASSVHELGMERINLERHGLSSEVVTLQPTLLCLGS